MAHLSSFIAAGLAGVIAWDWFVAPRPFDPATLESAATRTSVSTTPVDRSRKGDRLSAASPSNAAHPSIAKVEFGPGDSVLLRDRAGATLFSVDPGAQRTIIAKNVTLPQFTVQTSARNAPQAYEPQPVAPTPPEPPRATTVTTGRKLETKRPAGCDPAFSPIAAPQLGHLFGRCVTSVETPTKLAMVQ